MKTLQSINRIAGREVEITMLSDRDFTLSFYAIDKTATQKLLDFFGRKVVDWCEYPEGETYIYLTT